MGWNFPSRRIRHRLFVWRDRRRYPWHYPEIELKRRFGRRAAQGQRRRFFVIRTIHEAHSTEHYIFAECPNYPAAMEVAQLHGDRVFTEGQMLDHPERRRTLAAWDRGDGPIMGRKAAAAASSPRRVSADSFSTLEAPNG